MEFRINRFELIFLDVTILNKSPVELECILNTILHVVHKCWRHKATPDYTFMWDQKISSKTRIKYPGGVYPSKHNET